MEGSAREICVVMELGFESIGVGLSAGIYMLVYKGRVMYIGQSKIMLTRVHQHRHTKKSQMTPFGPKLLSKIPFDDVWVKRCHLSQADELEKDLIEKYKPIHNIKHNPRTEIYESFDIKALVRSLVPIKPREAYEPIDRRI